MATNVEVDASIERNKTIAGLSIGSPNSSKTTLSLLIYGEPGVGKTVFAGSASEVPEMQPVLLIDMEAGVLPLQTFYPNIDVVRVSSWKEMEQVYGEIRKGEVDYKTVIIDSLTEVQKFSMNTIMARVKKEDPERDEDIPSMREYGKNLEQMRRLVRRFRDLPVNTIFTCHAQQETYGKAERTRTKVSLTGKLASEVSGFMDIVLYMTVATKNKQEIRLVVTNNRGDVIAKDRTAKLPRQIEEPTMKLVYDQCFATSDTELDSLVEQENE